MFFLQAELFELLVIVFYEYYLYIIYTQQKSTCIAFVITISNRAHHNELLFSPTMTKKEKTAVFGKDSILKGIFQSMISVKFVPQKFRLF